MAKADERLADQPGNGLAVSRRSLITRLLLLVGIGGAVVWAGFHRGGLNPAAIDARLSGLGRWAPVVYVALYAAATVVFLPGSVFALASGALFGPAWGAALNLSAATLGAGAAFLVLAASKAGQTCRMKAEITST